MRKQVEQRLKEDLKGKRWKLILAMMIFMTVMALISSKLGEGTSTGLATVVTIIMAPGIYKIMLDIVYGNDIQWGKLFSSTPKEILGVLTVQLLMMIKCLLWSLLLFVPGIIRAYEYCLAQYVKMENPDWKAKECLVESKRIMEGHKMDLFITSMKYFLQSVIVMGILTAIFMIIIAGAVASRGTFALFTIVAVIPVFVILGIVQANISMNAQFITAEYYTSFKN